MQIKTDHSECYSGTKMSFMLVADTDKRESLRTALI